MSYEYEKQPMRIPLPGLRRQVGLGEAIKAGTSAVGIKPCGGCQKRAAWLDRHLVFVPRKQG